jgi:hypothetical protein
MIWVWLVVCSGTALADETTDDKGFSLDDEWQQIWRRVFDRTGRPDPQGPFQQRFAKKLYPEYELDQVVPDFPLHLERKWNSWQSGTRFWIHSYDATQLGNQIQVKVGGRITDNWRIQVQYDGLDTFVQRTDLVKVDFMWDPPRPSGPYVLISMFPRYEKQDIDFESAVGYRLANVGELRLRLFVLDAFTNGSYALASSDREPIEKVNKQTSLPLAAALEAKSVAIGGVRAEAYAGVVPPQTQRMFTHFLEENHTQEESALMFGTLLEWKAPALPLWVGANGLLFYSKYGVTARDPYMPENSPPENRLREVTLQARTYAIYRPCDCLTLEGQVRFTNRPERELFPELGDAVRKRRDREWISSIRGFWMFSKHVGLDLSYYNNNRDTNGLPDVFLDENGHRVVTRVLVQAGRLWASFGTGWDPDPRRSVYAGSGGTIIFNFD